MALDVFIICAVPGAGDTTSKKVGHIQLRDSEAGHLPEVWLRIGE